MGIGVFYFSKQVLDSRQVHIDYADYEDEQGDTTLEWNDLVCSIQSILPGSFFYRVDRDHPDPTWKGEGICIAWNGHVSIVLEDIDGTSACLAVVVSDDFDGQHRALKHENLAVAYLHKFAPKFLDKLSQYYSLRVRTSGWTTEAYRPALKAA